MNEWALLRPTNRELEGHMAFDNSKCANCGRPIAFKLTPRATGQYSDPVAEHKKDVADTDRLLNPRWLSATSLRERRKDLAARCQYGSS